MLTQRERELKAVTSIRDNPSAIIGKYMKLFDENADLMAVHSECERQLTTMSAMLREEKEKTWQAEDELHKYKKAVTDYEVKIQNLSVNIEEIRGQYSEAVSRLNEKEETITRLEIYRAELEAKIEELENSYAIASQAAEDSQRGLDEAIEMNDALIKELENEGGKNTLANVYRFGHRSEKTSNILGGHVVEPDPIDEDMECEESDDTTGAAESDGRRKPTSAAKATDRINEALEEKRRANGKDHDTDEAGKGDGNAPKRPRKPRKDPYEKYKNLPQVEKYKYDDEKEDSSDWERMGYEHSWTLKRTRPMLYVENTYRAKYKKKAKSSGLVRFYTVPIDPSAYRGCYGDPSLRASIICDHFVMGVTYYGLEEYFNMQGIDLQRQTTNRWVNRDAEEILTPICDEFARQLDNRYTVVNMDETYLRQVIWSASDKENGKHNGSMGILWLRVSGELSNGPKICLFEYCKSRSADYLRKALRKMVGIIVSDAYAAYVTIENESGGRIQVAMCWMHSRRYLAESVTVLDEDMKRLDLMSEDEMLNHPAIKSLLMLNDMFHAEAKIKKCKTADERRERRQKEVAPLVDAYFEYIKSIDLDGDEIFDRLKKAINYSLNNEEHLRRFLDNGEIPIDNGNSERYIKYAAKVRKNSLFAFNERGGDCFAKCLSVTRTAIANGVDPYIYVKFLLEEVPKYLDGTDLTFAADLMPWGSKYILYEKRHKEEHVDEFVPPSTPPRDDRKLHVRGWRAAV